MDPDFDVGMAEAGNGVSGDTNGVSKPKNKKKSIESIYQKKTQLEHIVLRPDTYIGSVQPITEKMWVLDQEQERIVEREITYVPGLFKIFDEILVNAADNKVRDPNMNTIKVNINPEKNEISIYNNGKGIPIKIHKTENMYVSTLIFGHLLTSSNFNDEDEKVTGGRNGYGAKLCNVFSTKFTVESASYSEHKKIKQTWTNNMTKEGEAKVKDFDGKSSKDDYTEITFSPDLAKFGMEKLDADTCSLLARRAYDVAASTRGGVKVILNGKKVPIKNFKEYVDFFIKDMEDTTGGKVTSVYESCGERWEVAVAVSENGFQQFSFVNSIATTKGGKHIDYVSKMIEGNLMELLKKKNKSGVVIKPQQIRNHLWIFVNCLIVNPTFDSQTKENMTLQATKFGSKCTLSPKFFTSLQKCGVVEAILEWSKFKAEKDLKNKHSSKKTNKLRGISKLEDANDAGTKNSMDCTLILTEGDSAKSLAVAGLSIVGRDKYGVFPLRGKLLNVREATHKQILENKEINEMIKILGLTYKKHYSNVDDLKSLRYGRLMIMTDQDQDGSHIKGLLINFIHHNWPSLLRLPFIEEFITPIVKATKGNESHSFYSLPEFHEWKNSTDNWHTYKIKYYKGLGTSTSKEAKEYFSDMQRHRIKFQWRSDQDDHSINMAFSKKEVTQRKDWLTTWMEECKRRRELGLPEIYLYEKNTRSVTYSDFINKELILFSNLDNERSIPSIVDGFKPGQRKVMFTCLKRNDKREVKVAQLAGSVGEMSAYHHGEASLMGTIINLAQNFVGSNNINLLQPIGQFGTRLAGGKDHASPRYIFTQLSPLARHVFNQNDDPLLNYLNEDNQKIEPEWYIPILPMVLVNGADGIGTGWMTKIPNYNPREIVRNIKRMLDGLEPEEMIPWFKGFKGSIEDIDSGRFVINGEVAHLSDTKIEITELPIRTWTQTYKEGVMEPMLNGSEKQAALIQDYKEYHTDKTVKFVVQLGADSLRKAELDKGLHQFFKLQTTITTTSMVLFDAKGCLRRFDTACDILREFFDLRLEYYGKRKKFLEGMLEAEALKLSNQARFILEKCDGTLTVENKKKKAMIDELHRKGFDSDPVKKWKKSISTDSEETAGDEEEEEDETLDYDYLLGMPMWSLTFERKEELLKRKDEKQHELRVLRGLSKEDLWRNDLAEFSKKLDEVETKEIEDDFAHMQGKQKGHGKKVVKAEALPSPVGIRVAPRIPAELRVKAAKAMATKEKKAEGKTSTKEELEKDEFDFMVDEAEMSGLLSDKSGYDVPKSKGGKAGAGGGGGAGKGKAKRKRSSGSEDDSDNGFTKGKGGRNPWSDDGSDSDWDDDKPKKKKGPAGKKTKKAASDSEDDLFDSLMESSPVKKPAPKPAAKPTSFDDSDSDTSPVSKPAPKSKAKPAFADSDSEASPVKKPAPKAKAFSDSDDDMGGASAPFKADSDLDSDDDFGYKPKSKAKANDSDSEGDWKPKPVASKPKGEPKAKAPPKPKAEKKPKEPKAPKAPKPPKEAKPKAPPKPKAEKKPKAEPKPKAAKKAKKNFSDDESGDDMFDTSQSPSGADLEKVDRGGMRRAATAKITYNFSSGDEDFSD